MCGRGMSIFPPSYSNLVISPITKESKLGQIRRTINVAEPLNLSMGMILCDTHHHSGEACALIIPILMVGDGYVSVV